MQHVAFVLEWNIREPEGVVRVDGISLHQTQLAASLFEKFWQEHHDLEGEFILTNMTTMKVTDEVWKKIAGEPSIHQYFRNSQFAEV